MWGDRNRGQKGRWAQVDAPTEKTEARTKVRGVPVTTTTPSTERPEKVPIVIMRFAEKSTEGLVETPASDELKKTGAKNASRRVPAVLLCEERISGLPVAHLNGRPVDLLLQEEMTGQLTTEKKEIGASSCPTERAETSFRPTEEFSELPALDDLARLVSVEAYLAGGTSADDQKMRYVGTRKRSSRSCAGHSGQPDPAFLEIPPPDPSNPQRWLEEVLQLVRVRLRSESLWQISIGRKISLWFEGRQLLPSKGRRLLPSKEASSPSLRARLASASQEEEVDYDEEEVLEVELSCHEEEEKEEKKEEGSEEDLEDSRRRGGPLSEGTNDLRDTLQSRRSLLDLRGPWTARETRSQFREASILVAEDEAFWYFEPAGSKYVVAAEVGTVHPPQRRHN